jgi:hypothetical protein
MSHPDPEQVVAGLCPNCGWTRIQIILEGATTFFMDGPNEYYALWIGRCDRCQNCIEANFSDGDDLHALSWEVVDEEKVEFLLGLRRPLAPSTRPTDRPGDPELDG